MPSLVREVAAAWRRLLKTPVFSIFSVIILALSIGAVTSTDAIIRALEEPPGGIPDVGELLQLSHTEGGSGPIVMFSAGDYEDLRARQTTMADVVGFATSTQVMVAEGQSRHGIGEFVTGNYFDLLGVNAIHGRTIRPEDDHVGATPVIVISHQFWEHFFGGRPDAVGGVVRFGGHPFQVVGVAPPDFVGLYNNGHIPAQAWVPLSLMDLTNNGIGRQRREDRNARWLSVRARPRPGYSIEQVRADVTAIAEQLDREYPIGEDLPDSYLGSYAKSRRWMVRYAKDLMLTEPMWRVQSRVVTTLHVAVAFVLVLVCSNLANLVVARGAVRRHEMALRLAFGASRLRLITSVLAEVGLVAAAGCLAGLFLTAVVMRLLSVPFDAGMGATFLLLPRVDLWTAFVVAMGGLVTLALAGGVPAFILTRSGPHAELVSGAGPTVISKWRIRRLLIGGQVAVSVVLLAMAAVFVGQVAAASRFDGGLDLDRFAVATTDLGIQGYDDARMSRLVDLTLDHLQQIPGIEAAAASAGLPLGPTAPWGQIDLDGQVYYFEILPATPSLFQTVGIELIHGRGFDAETGPDRLPEAVIGEELAVRIFGRTDVVGLQLDLDASAARGADSMGGPHTIVGVASATARSANPSWRSGTVFVPLKAVTGVPLVISARSSGDLGRVAEHVRSALSSVEPEIGIVYVGGAREVAGLSTGLRMILAGTTGLLGGTGFVVALAGLYGVLSYLVARRTREVGMRLALGATRTHVVWLVIRDGLTPVVVGLVIGLGGAYLLNSALPAIWLVPVQLSDRLLLVGVPLLMLGTGFIACYLPARRASLIDPVQALKQ